MLSKQLILLAALALLTLFAVGWISDHSTRVMAEAVESLDRTRDVILAVDHFRAELVAAEGSARGFVITGLPAFRSDFERADRAARRSLAHLKSTTASDTNPPKIATLDQLTLRHLELLRELVVLAEGESPSASINQNVVDGTAVSRRIGDVLRSVQIEELGHLNRQTSAAATAVSYALYGPWLMCAIAALMFALMLAQFSVTLRRANEMSEHLLFAALREQEAREKAQEADQMKDQFLATVSHELRTPLTSIIGWCGLLRGTEADASLIHEGITNITEAAKVQSHLVEDLLDISRIIAGKLSLYISAVDPSDVVDKAIASVQPSARAKRITIRKLLAGPVPRISGDATRIEQVVWNLLSNAIKFSPAGETISVSLTSTDSHVGIEVVDHGEGIPPALLPHIFERFRQGDASGSRHGGLGLGLSIVRNLVELHGGTVQATSAGSGTGATFRVMLPVSPK